MSSLLSRCAPVAAALIMSYPAVGQPVSYPSQAVKIVVPNAPGGGTDFVARLISKRLAERLKQPFVVENRPGANGNIAMASVARAKPDGYALIFTSTGTIATNPFLYGNIDFHPTNDFEPISLAVTFFQVLAMNPKVPVKDLREFLNYAKNNPRVVTSGNGGLGGTSHLATELLQRMANVQLSIIPYRGTSPAVTDLLGGQIATSFTGLPAGAAHFEAKTLVPLGITSPKRSNLLPHVPAIAEVVSGYEMDGWFGLFGPANMPSSVVNKLSSEIDMILKEPATRDQLLALAYEIVGGPPDNMKKVLAADLERYERIVREAGIKLQ